MFDFIIIYKKKRPIRLINIEPDAIRTLLQIMMDTNKGITKLMNVIKKGHPLTIEHELKEDMIIKIFKHDNKTSCN